MSMEEHERIGKERKTVNWEQAVKRTIKEWKMNVDMSERKHQIEV